MKRYFIIVFVFIFSIVFAADFRKSSWGDSQKAVMKKDGKPTYIKKYTLQYAKFKLAGYDTNLYYYFHKDKLYQACYAFQFKFTNPNNYVEEYYRIIKLLEKKYKKVEPEYIWLNNYYKDDTAHYGMAVAMGHLRIATKYILGDTEILLLLSGENYESDIILGYKSLKLAKQAREAEEKEKSNEF
jgi:hypothetical protein